MSALRFYPTPSISTALVSLGLLLSVSACAKRAHVLHQQTNDQQSVQIQSSASRVNINTASSKELETLPGIGKGLAERIIEHREKYGPFQRSEHLMIVRGISDRRFRSLRNLIAVE